MPGSINSHYFHIIGDGKNQPNSRGLYTHYKDSYSRWDDHPQYSDFDHGTYRLSDLELASCDVCPWYYEISSYLDTPGSFKIKGFCAGS